MVTDTTIRPAGPVKSGAAGARGAAPAAAPASLTAALDARRDASVRAGAAAAAGPVPLKRGIAHFDNALQGQVARAQQALDYLQRVAGQLESLKGELAARLSGARSASRQLETRARQLAASLDARPASGGGGIDAQLDFAGGQPASQRFRIRELDLGALQESAPQSLVFMVGGGPQLSATVEPGMSKAQIAQRLDRALSPMKVRAALDNRGELVFSTPEANWTAVQDSIAVSGRGRVQTEAEAPVLAPQRWETGSPDALRQSLREVVQALERVRRSQDAAGAALSAATAQAAQSQAQVADAAVMAQDFAETASNPDYESLLAITSALVGVSRERVLALLGLH